MDDYDDYPVERVDRAALGRQIRLWATELLPAAFRSFPVIVTEMRCNLPGCGRETTVQDDMATEVAVLLSPAHPLHRIKPTWDARVHKEMHEVTRADLQQAIEAGLGLCAGLEEELEHAAAGAPPPGAARSGGRTARSDRSGRRRDIATVALDGLAAAAPPWLLPPPQQRQQQQQQVQMQRNTAKRPAAGDASGGGGGEVPRRAYVSSTPTTFIPAKRPRPSPSSRVGESAAPDDAYLR